MSDRHISTVVDNGVLTITFDRPKIGNALSLLMVQQISEELKKAKEEFALNDDTPSKRVINLASTKN